MLPWLEILILAVVQGLTEFLPVSSSGHLVLLQSWFGGHEGDLFLDVVLHCGTLGSVLVVYRRELIRLLRFDESARRYILTLIVGTLPAVVIGLLLRDLISTLFQSPVTAALGLLLTAGVLLSTRSVTSPNTESGGDWQPQAIPLRKALLIGTAQAMAICPGVSRSGSTIAASLWVGLARAEAARFSFMLSVPAIAGALLLELLGGELTTRVPVPGLVMAALVSFGVGLLAIRWTTIAVVQRHFWKFAFYCLALGIAVLAILL